MFIEKYHAVCASIKLPETPKYAPYELRICGVYEKHTELNFAHY